MGAVAANSRWLEECIMLLLCVLSLDRFADYGSDQVMGLSVLDSWKSASCCSYVWCCWIVLQTTVLTR